MPAAGGADGGMVAMLPMPPGGVSGEVDELVQEDPL